MSVFFFRTNRRQRSEEVSFCLPSEKRQRERRSFSRRNLNLLLLSLHPFLPPPPQKKKNAYTTKGKSGHVNYATVPSIVYTWPECASVGQTEEEVKASGTPYKTGKFAFMANSRARASDDAEGVVKFIAHAETDKILGAHIMGPNAGELIGTLRLF